MLWDLQKDLVIVKSYGTIEVQSTDAEGRLVLADALTFTEEKFKPKFCIHWSNNSLSRYMLDFFNDDKQGRKKGRKLGECLFTKYDKLMNSKC